MSKMATAADRKRHGKHYTPEELARFLASRVLAHVTTDDPLAILDPACGDGELLFAIHEVASALPTGLDVTLVGYELDAEAAEFARLRASTAGIEVTIHEGDFLVAAETLPDGSFDAIITNPPYVRTQQLGSDASRVLAEKFGLSGRIDLTHPFVAIAPRLLKQGGVLGLLSSNRFLTTKAGSNVREVLSSRFNLVELYDLGDTRLFQAAVLPAITVATRESPREVACPYVSAYEVAADGSRLCSDLFEALSAQQDFQVLHDGREVAVRAGTLQMGTLPTEPWRMVRTDDESWLQGLLKSSWSTFGDLAKIRVGIKTTADGVFISDEWESADPQPEPSLLLPLVTHDNITPWKIGETRTRVLYPYELKASRRTLVDMDRFPAAMAYLESHASRLKSRQYVIDGGRKWYEIWVPQRPALWRVPKIVFPDISEQPRFTYDKSGAVVNGDCYWISLADLDSEDVAFLMLGVANSSLATRFYDAVCGNRLYSGRRRWITQYVSKFPVPNPASEPAQELIELCRSLSCGLTTPTPEVRSMLDNLVERSFQASEPTPRSPTLF